MCVFDTQVLLHLEFLDSRMQRIAVEAAANMCRAVTPETFEMVQEQLGKLVTLLKYEVRLRALKGPQTNT